MNSKNPGRTGLHSRVAVGRLVKIQIGTILLPCKQVRWPR